MAAPATDATKAERVALVLGGGGARGAYEIGALSVLLPKLKELGMSPNIIFGTSIGGLHAAYLAAHAHEEPDQALVGAQDLWNNILPRDAFNAFRAKDVPQGLGFLGTLIGIRHDRVFGLLDTDQLERKLKEIVSREDLHQIEENVKNDDVPLDTVGVVATQSPTSRSIVFMCSTREPPPTNALRGIRYVRTPLTHEHVLASIAIPLVFPAREVKWPPCAAGWYCDGGIRLNTPIKPAIELDVDRVVVIAMDSLHIGWEPAKEQPDIADAAAQVLNALLLDPLVQDVHTLALKNEAAMGAQEVPYDVIPYMFVAPSEPNVIANLAWEVWKDKYGGSFKDLGLMGRALGAAGEAGHGEVLSHLLFDKDFTSQLLDRGADDARQWLAERPADPWEVKPLRESDPPGPCDEPQTQPEAAVEAPAGATR